MIKSIFERGAGSDAPCSRSGGDRRILFSKRVARLCKAVNKGSLAGSPSPGLCPLEWWVSPGPGGGECPMARGRGAWPGGPPLAKQASGQSKKRDGQKVARASYSTLGVSRPRVPIPGVPIPGVSIAGVPPQKTLTQIPFSYQHPAPRSWGKAGLWPC